MCIRDRYKHAVIVRPAEEQQLPPACGRITQNNGSGIARPVSSTGGEHAGGALEAPAGGHLAPYGINVFTGQDAAQPQSLGQCCWFGTSVAQTGVRPFDDFGAVADGPHTWRHLQISTHCQTAGERQWPRAIRDHGA